MLPGALLRFLPIIRDLGSTRFYLHLRYFFSYYPKRVINLQKNIFHSLVTKKTSGHRSKSPFLHGGISILAYFNIFNKALSKSCEIVVEIDVEVDFVALRLSKMSYFLQVIIFTATRFYFEIR